MPRKFKLSRRAGVRFALLHTFVFVISVAAVGFVAEVLVTRALKDQASKRVIGETAELVEEFKQYGSEAFHKLIDTQTASGKSHLHYAVLGGDGQWVAGEHLVARAAASLPPLSTPIPVQVKLSGSDAFLLTRRSLDDGTVLVVADDLGSVEDVEDVVSSAFAIVLAISIALGLASGFLLTGELLRRVNAVTQTAEAIIAGDLTRRIAPTGAGDEFDRLGATLNVMLDRIVGLMDNLRQVSDDIAHDLRTPLSRLRQSLEHTRTHAAMEQDYELAIERAIEEVDGLLATFSALLRIAQVEAGARRQAFRAVDLTEVVETVCEAYAPALEDGGRSITSDIATGVVLNGDRDLLAQMFANLIENAIGHTPPRTAIRVRLRGIGTDGSGALAEVCDDGPGIPLDEHEKVFRRFYRLERSRTTPGNGLGLSAVAAIAELHGAMITLSNADPGLRVTVRFPPLDQERDAQLGMNTNLSVV